MDDSPQDLTAAALRLPPVDRAKLAEALLVSLEKEDASWETAWLVEAARRSQAAAADPARVRPAAEMFARVRERFPDQDDRPR